MSKRSLYDEDILLWSEQQAAAVRRLGERPRNVPNELDIDNVAEEIESVGRSELAVVESNLRLVPLALGRGYPAVVRTAGSADPYLGRTRPDLASELDIGNVADEIECVGRAELAAAKAGCGAFSSICSCWTWSRMGTRSATGALRSSAYITKPGAVMPPLCASAPAWPTSGAPPASRRGLSTR